jgi:hypothetical protein
MSVPLIPIAKPTCACLRAGASFVPSPVTATMFPNCFNPKTNKNLSSGEALAITFNLFTICLKLSLLFNDISTAPVFSSFFLVRFPQLL